MHTFHSIGYSAQIDFAANRRTGIGLGMSLTPEQQEIFDAYRWLVGERGRSILDALSRKARVDWTGVSRLQRYLADEQILLRNRSLARFPDGQRWWWTDVGLQQASDWLSACYKASLFPQGTLVSDLCCGIGADLVALRSRGTAIGIDHNPIQCLLATENLKEHQLEASVLCEDVLETSLSNDSFVHVDPDRRPDGQRVTNLDFMEPAFDDLWRSLQVVRGGCIKLAPATEVSDDALGTNEYVSEWIGTHRECRQQLLWWGELPHCSNSSPGDRLATVLQSDGTANSFSGTPTTDIAFAESAGDFLYDLAPPIRAANLTEALANDFDLEGLGGAVGYLTGGKVESPLLIAYEVVAQLGWNERRVKQQLRELKAGPLVVKKRGCKGTDANVVQRQLSSPDGTPYVLFLTQIDRKEIAIIARPSHDREEAK